MMNDEEWNMVQTWPNRDPEADAPATVSYLAECGLESKRQNHLADVSKEQVDFFFLNKEKFNQAD